MNLLRSRRIAPLMLLTAMFSLAWVASGDDSRPDALARMAQPDYNDDGALLRPDGYERWTLVGTSLGLSYLPSANDDDAEEGNAKDLGIFHNVYMQPEAFDHYVATGEFPEQTIFVVTNNPPTRTQGHDDINRRGHFAGDPTGLEVSVKDSQRFDDGWGYFLFTGTKGRRTAAKPMPRQICYDCHAEHGQDDAVFVQFYRVLESARERQLESEQEATSQQ